MKRLIKHLINSLGYDLKKYQPAPSTNFHSSRANSLMRFVTEFSVNCLLDIGANVGQYAAAFRDLGFQGNIVSFEPLDGPFSILKKRAENDGKWNVENVAVGNDDGEVVIHVAGNSESSSLLPMLSLHLDAYPPSAYESEQITKLVRLDSVCPEIVSGADRLAMKLDVQGYELQALKGARDLLKQVYVIDIELSLDSLYEGQPSFIEIIEFLESEGFTAVSFENGFIDPRNGHALQVDAVFLRKTRPGQNT